MKSSIACFVAAVSNFLETNKKINGSISFLITGDEEAQAINGTKKVVDYLIKKKEKIDFCIVGEPTNPNKLGEMIKIGRRGSLSCKLTYWNSRSCCLSTSFKNPINSLIDICKKLKEKPLDKGIQDFQPSNLEFTAINVDNLVTMSFQLEQKLNLILDIIIITTSVSLKRMNNYSYQFVKKTKQNIKLIF